MVNELIAYMRVVYTKGDMKTKAEYLNKVWSGQLSGKTSWKLAR